MLDQLINLVKENAGNAVINNNDVPNEKNDAVINTAADGIMNHFKNLAGNGGLGAITDIIKGNNVANNPEVTKMATNIAGSISEKYGIGSGKAEGIVKDLIPAVLSNLSKTTNDPNDSRFTLEGILGSLTGGSKDGLGGILDKVKKMF